MSLLLLDTCALIWMAEDTPIAEEAVRAINNAYEAGEDILVSPMSAWEIGLLVSRDRLTMSLHPNVWFERFMAKPGLRLADLSPAILIESSMLPKEPPRDPVDRIILSTARMDNLTIITRDRLILDYACLGHVRAMAC